MTNYAALSTRIRHIVDRYAVTNPVPAALAALWRSPIDPVEIVEGAPSHPDRRPMVSVVIPCYNYGHFLRGAVQSALTQEAVDVRVIIVNDRSPDDTALIADGVAEGDQRVEVVHNEVNLGHVRAFNRGLEHATGEFLVRLDADDLLTPGCLARAVALFDHRRDVGLVYGNPYHFQTAQPPLPRVSRLSWAVWSGADWLAERCRTGVNCITTPEAMLRMSVVREVGPLDTRLRFAQDMEMWCRVAAVSNVGRVRGADQALHRDHPTSMSATDAAATIVDLQERRQVFDSVFEGAGRRLANATALHDLARTALAEEAVAHAERALDRGDHDLATQLLDYARSTAPPALCTSWVEAVVRRSHNLTRPSVARLMQRRILGLSRELDYLRWAVHGV